MSEWPDDLREMYSRYGSERTNGGKGLTIEDHVHVARKCRQFGEGPEQLADALGVPLHYAEALLRAAASE
jgi:hypothetical protein